jgi:ribosome biogenesis GTPase
MRELQLDTADLAKSFSDIEALAMHCRFSDCAHQGEPGCAVGAAIAKGELLPERLHSYVKLQGELSYQGMSARQREQEKIQRMFGGVGGMKQARDFVKLKNRQK